MPKYVEEQNEIDAVVDALKAQSTGEDSVEAKAIDAIAKLREIATEGVDLMGLASYAEIVGGVGVNRAGVRKACDLVIAANNKLAQPIEYKSE